MFDHQTENLRSTSWDDISQQYQLDHQLVRYTLAGRVALTHGRHKHFVKDAHSGYGLKLQNTVIAVNNLIVLAPPQVSLSFLHRTIPVGRFTCLISSKTV